MSGKPNRLVPCSSGDLRNILQTETEEEGKHVIDKNREIFKNDIC